MRSVETGPPEKSESDQRKSEGRTETLLAGSGMSMPTPETASGASRECLIDGRCNAMCSLDTDLHACPMLRILQGQRVGTVDVSSVMSSFQPQCGGDVLLLLAIH